MAHEENAAGMNKSAFANAFATLRPAILAEWSELSQAALGETAGELDKVVALVAESTTHTKALVRRQLEEIYRVVMEPVAEPSRGRARRVRAAAAAATGEGETGAHLDQLLEEFERRTAHIIRELRGGFFDGARERVRGNVVFSLLITLGLGFIVGVLFSGSSRAK
jgi:hypothetical protein